MSPFAHAIDISESSVRIYKGKGRYTMCFSGHMGSVVCIKLSESGSPTKLLHIKDIPDFPSEPNIED